MTMHKSGRNDCVSPGASVSFDYHPYMKHSTAEPQQEQTLGQYIARKADPVVKKLTFEEFLLSKAKREDGSYSYGFDPTRPRDFLCMGIEPWKLELVWKTAQENV